MVLDFDAANDPVHGQQNGRSSHVYYDEYCFLPPYEFRRSDATGMLAYLRDSDIGTVHHACEAILILLAKRSRLALAEGQNRLSWRQRLFVWTEYGTGTWDFKCPIMMKAGHSAEGPNPRLVATSLTGDAQGLYDTTYCARGQAAN